MKPLYKVILLCLVLIFTVSVVSILLRNENSDVVTLRLGHSLSTKHVVHKSLKYFQQQVAQISNNHIKVDIYPSGQLGSERDMVELLQVGSLAMTKVSAGSMEAFVPIMQVFSLPYVFKDSEHYWKVLNSDIGKNLLDAPETVGLKGLAYLDAGSRNFYTCGKPINRADDLQGAKIRTMKSQTAVNLMSALGASATPISFGELYTALQQGVVDGAENNAVTFYSSRHFEVCKHYALDEHNSIPDMIIISDYIWQNLNTQQQRWINQAMAKTVTYQRNLWEIKTQEAMTGLLKQGVEITYPDKSLFRQKVASYKRSFAGSEIGKLLKRIDAL